MEVDKSTKGIFLSFGGNQANVLRSFELAKELLEDEGCKILAESQIYKTEPVGFLDQDWFTNEVVQVSYNGDPHQLLRLALNVEQKLGRVRKENKWGPRTMDIDLLFFDQQVIQTDDLILPHPEIPFRRFVLEPLKDIAPNFQHPVLKQPISELLAELMQKETASVVKLPNQNSI